MISTKEHLNIRTKKNPLPTCGGGLGWWGSCYEIGVLQLHPPPNPFPSREGESVFKKFARGSIRQFIGVAVLCIGSAVALTGCSRSPRVSFYTLAGGAEISKVNPSRSAPSVSVVNITLPDLVDRPQLVERVSGNRVEILETHRWAEPLKNGISRLLAENLAGRLGSDRVTAYPQNSVSDPDYKVYVDIQRFESVGDSVSVDAIWTIRRKSDGAPGRNKEEKSKTGRSQTRESRGKEGYDALVEAYNRAIISVSNDIAKAIISEWPNL
ncbi:MAG: PqiC family protein [Desulfuromonadaceae bacterium]|nr:PqiC family protein [Desulfuromonadaceae bacterium]